MLKVILIYLSLLAAAHSYNAYEDERIIRGLLEKPSPPKDHAKIARHLVHKSDWAAFGTISTNEKIKGFPMVNIISIADSARGSPSTGDIFFVLTDLDFTGQDILENNKITFMISDDEDLSCSKQNDDPMEPTCARVIISGSVAKLEPGTSEYNFANISFASRHPAVVNWNKAHDFYLCRLIIENIYVLDWYGGPHDVSVEDYYASTPVEDFDDNISDNAIPPMPSMRRNQFRLRLSKYKYDRIRIEID